MGSPRPRPSSDSISQFDEGAAAAFDQWSLGIIRVSPDLKIAAWNQTAAETLGLTSLEGRSADQLLADQQSIEALRSEWAQRRQGTISELEINVLHFPEGRSVPVRLSAMPMISDSGVFAGGFAIFHSLEVERHVRAFEEAIHRAQGATAIFQAVCDQVRPVLNFDFAAFSIYSKTGHHAGLLHSYDPKGLIASYKRWYPISGKLAEWSQNHHEQVVEDYADFVRQFAELHDDPTVQQFLNAGFVKFARFPVVRGGRVVASFSCFSRDRTAFGKPEMRIAKSLPIAKAFLLALHSLENDELSFRVDLIRGMFICRTQKEIADLSARKIAEQYGWKSVEIYTIEEASREIRLVSQWSSSDYALDEGYAQSMDRGILGYVCSTDQDLRIDNVNSDPKFKDVFVRLHPGTLSELCMPIRVNGRISALLNVEDKHENAFSLEEQENLRSLLDEIGGLFGAVWNKALKDRAFEATPSMVLIADRARTVVECNGATVSRLGFGLEELIGSPVNAYFEPEIADRLFQAPRLIGIETEMRRKDGTTLPVLLGAQELEGFGAWVISARDLTAQKRIAELETLRYMYREIAVQTKTPLSLAYSWIQRLERQARKSQSDTAETLHKTLAQLRKVDMTYERLALYSQEAAATTCNELLLNAGDFLKRTIDEVPDGLLSVEGLDRENFYIRGDPYQIDFAIESMISYLQRFLPNDERIFLRLKPTGERLLIEIEGPLPPKPRWGDGELSDGAVPEAVCRAIHEMSLGAEIIGKLMQQHGGEFRQEALPGNRVRFQLGFPLQHLVV